MAATDRLPKLTPTYRPELTEDEHCTEAARELEAAHDALIRAMRHLDGTETRQMHLEAFQATAAVDQVRSMLSQREANLDARGRFH